MEYIHASQTKEPLGPDNVVTLRDDVIDYKGMNVLVQTNEADTDCGSRVKYVNVTELLEPLYDSSNEHSVGLTKARKIENLEEKKELTDIIRELGIQEPINF